MIANANEKVMGDDQTTITNALDVSSSICCRSRALCSRFRADSIEFEHYTGDFEYSQGESSTGQ